AGYHSAVRLWESWHALEDARSAGSQQLAARRYRLYCLAWERYLSEAAKVPHPTLAPPLPPRPAMPGEEKSEAENGESVSENSPPPLPDAGEDLTCTRLSGES